MTDRVALVSGIVLISIFVAFCWNAQAQTRRCGHGYHLAVIGRKEKCLKPGEECSHNYAAEYRRYGFRCVLVYGPGNIYALKG